MGEAGDATTEWLLGIVGTGGMNSLTTGEGQVQQQRCRVSAKSLLAILDQLFAGFVHDHRVARSSADDETRPLVIGIQGIQVPAR